MSYTDVITGNFQTRPRNVGIFPTFPAVAVDSPVNPAGTYTNGITVVDPLAVNPSILQKWQITGYSVRLLYGLLIGTGAFASRMYYGILGDLWVGLLQDSSIQSGGPFPLPAQFPTDMSTFTPVFDGATSPLRGVSDPLNETQYEILTTTFMLPSPIDVRPSSQLQMAVVLKPSLIACAGIMPSLVLKSYSYSVIYADLSR